MTMLAGLHRNGLYWLALIPFRARRFDVAAKVCQRISRTWPLDPTVLWLRAAALGEAARTSSAAHDQAIDAYKQFLAVHSTSPQSWFILGSLLQHRGDHQEAVQSFNEALNRCQGDPPAEYFYGLGFSLLQLAQWESAADAFRDAVHRNRQASDAIENLAIALARAGRQPESLRWFQRALDISPSTATRLNLAKALAESEGFGEAEDVLKRGLTVDPVSMDLRMRLAGVIAAQDRFDEALTFAQEAHAGEPNDQSAFAAAHILSMLGRPSESVALLREFTKNNAESPRVLGMLGWTLVQTGKGAEAVDAFERSIQESQSQAPEIDQRVDASEWLAWLHGGRGAALTLLGRYQESIADFEEAVRLSPDCFKLWADFKPYYQRSVSHVGTRVEHLASQQRRTPEHSAWCLLPARVASGTGQHVAPVAPRRT